MRAGIFILTVLVVCVLALVPAFAQEAFDVRTVTVSESVLPGESAVFELYVTNTLDRADRYTVSSAEYGYILFIDPRPGEIASGQEAMFGVEISPRSFINQGTRRVPLRIRSAETGQSEEVQVIMFIRDPDRAEGQYTPSIALGVSAPSEVDPRDDLTIGVSLRNRNAREYTKEGPITVSIESDLFAREYQTQLGGVGDEGEKTSEIRLDLDHYQVPGTHPLLVRLIIDNVTISTQSTQFTIVPYGSVEESRFVESGFFKTQTHIKVRNEGNIDQDATVLYPVNVLARPFISATENYVIEDVDGERSLVIEDTLSPQEERTVTVTENYRLLALLILLAILSVIGYFLLRSPVVLGKEAGLAGSSSEGVSEIKVRILVKNRSSKTMRNLRVIDRISGMADVIKEQALGTLKPTKVVKKKGQGTLIRWDLDVLEPFEERIITYRATTPLKLIGDVTLPAVKVKYDLPSGRERTAHSNEVSVSRAD